MKIILAYNRNNYAAFQAAYLRLKLDPSLLERIKKIFKANANAIQPYYLGLDKDLNEVYIVNCGKDPIIFKNSIEGLGKIYGEEVEVILIN